MANGCMTVEIQKPSRDAPLPVDRDVLRAMFAGFRLHCPSCNSAPLFARYLKAAHTCGKCGTELHHHRADDAPPYFTIFIVGHVMLAGVLALEQAYSPQTWVHLTIWVPLTLVVTLALLPRIKGSLIGLQWALRMHGFGTGPDPTQPDCLPESPASNS